MNLIYSTVYVSRRGFLGGTVTLLDDWLKRDRFTVIGGYLNIGIGVVSFIYDWCEERF